MNRSRVFLWGAPLLICITQLPLFLQSTLTPDAVLYDLQARCLLEGGVLYRDIVEPNLPGVVWVHAVVRRLAGPSSSALLGFDFAVVIGIAFFLCRLVCGTTQKREQSGLIEQTSQPCSRETLVTCVFSSVLLFYFGTSEWCHGQRDTWMLLPCLAAILIRSTLCTELVPSKDSSISVIGAGRRGTTAWCIIEGMLWAAGFWLKPFVAFPAAAVLLASAAFMPARKFWFAQIGAVIFGGLLVGCAGIAWMETSGCWPHFVDMLTTWNGDYFQSGRSRWSLDRFLSHATRFWPWILLHVPATIISGKTFLPSKSNASSLASMTSDPALRLLQAGYLGWIIQAFAFQQLFDYIHVPGMFLAMSLCLQAVFRMGPRPEHALEQWSPVTGFRKVLTSLALVVALAEASMSPAFAWNRQQHWASCVRACVGQPLAAEAKDEIALVPFPRWSELQPVVTHLKQLSVPDRSVLAYNGNLIHLYPQTDSHAPTRFVYVDVLARCFPRRRPEIQDSLDSSGIRYVISDLREDGWEGSLTDHELLPLQISQHSDSMFFPYNQKPVFRSGGYVLFEVVRTAGFLTSDYSPLAIRQNSQLTEKNVPGITRK